MYELISEITGRIISSLGSLPPIWIVSYISLFGLIMLILTKFITKMAALTTLGLAEIGGAYTFMKLYGEHVLTGEQIEFLNRLIFYPPLFWDQVLGFLVDQGLSTNWDMVVVPLVMLLFVFVFIIYSLKDRIKSPFFIMLFSSVSLGALSLGLRGLGKWMLSLGILWFSLGSLMIFGTFSLLFLISRRKID